MNSVCICGTIKNCGKYIKSVFENITQIISLFDHHRIILYYDESDDNTLELLNEYGAKFKIILHYNKKYSSKYRTHRLAHGRNMCLNIINKKFSNFEYFIMMDFDDVCAEPIKINSLINGLNKKDKWDALSFNKTDYYDIWALSVKPYIFSFAHFNNPGDVCGNMKNYIANILNNLNQDELFRCHSAFNGFCIYKTDIFKDLRYSGKVCLNLIPKKLIEENKKCNNSDIVFNNSQWVNSNNNMQWLYSKHEDCEHRSFHMYSILKKNAKICISPEILF